MPSDGGFPGCHCVPGDGLGLSLRPSEELSRPPGAQALQAPQLPLGWSEKLEEVGEYSDDEEVVELTPETGDTGGGP